MNDVSVILTLYQRNNLGEQLERVLSQTIHPREIFIYQNEFHVDAEDIINRYNSPRVPIYHIHSVNYNFKFHGRFTLPLLFSTRFTALFDDDTLPNPQWLECCLRVYEKHKHLSDSDDCIVGGRGILLKDPDNLSTVRALGVPDTTDDTIVDFVGHAWFFTNRCAHSMWKYRPPSLDNSEDLHFSAANKLHTNTPTIFPAQSWDNQQEWGDSNPSMSDDDFSSYKKSGHSEIRAKCAAEWIQKGWKPCLF